MTDETKADKKTQNRWQYYGRSWLPGRKDAKGNKMFGKRVEYRQVPNPAFFDGYEWREESTKSRDKRRAIADKLAAKANAAAAKQEAKAKAKADKLAAKQKAKEERAAAKMRPPLPPAKND